MIARGAALVVVCALQCGAAGTAIADDHLDGDGLDAQGRAMLDPRRSKLLNTAELIRRLDIRPDAVISDVGAGPGFLTLPLAEAALRGRVIATDVRADYLTVLDRRATEAGRRNIETKHVTRDDPGLAPRSVDLIILCQVDHLLDDRARYLAALERALRPGGRIVLVNLVSSREADLAAAKAASLAVVDEWRPSAPYFVLVLRPR